MQSINQFDTQLTGRGRSLYAYALKLTRNPEDAQDLVQDTYTSALRGRTNYTSDINFNGWLTTIMKNKYINDYRLKVRKPVEFVAQIPDCSRLRSYNIAEQNMEMRQILSAFDKLPPKLKPVAEAH